MFAQIERRLYLRLLLLSSCWFAVSCSLDSTSTDVSPVKEFEGFSESDALKVILDESSDNLALHGAYSSEDSILKYERPSDSEAESVSFSAAVFVKDLQEDPVTVAYCSELEFGEKITSVSEVVAGRQAAEQCGELSFFVCVASVASGATQSQYGISPQFKVKIPCAESSFADTSIGIENSSYLATNVENPNINLNPGRFVYEYSLFQSSDCSPESEWKASDFVHPSFDLVVSEEAPSSAKVYYKLKDVIGNESECLTAEILVDKVPPLMNGVSLDSLFALSSSTLPDFSWEAGEDAESGIRGYQVGMSPEGEDTVYWSQTIAPADSTSLSNAVLEPLMERGISYKGAIRAIDQAGNYSEVGFTTNTFRRSNEAVALSMNRKYTCVGVLDPLSQTEKIKCFGKKDIALGLNLEPEYNGIPTTHWPTTKEDFRDNTYVKLPYQPTQTIEQISTGINRTCVLFKDQGQSIVRCWGRNLAFLGLGKNASEGTGLGNIGGLPIDPALNNGEDVTAVDLDGADVESICVAETHNCALINVPATEDEPARGDVKCWGRVSHLGLGTTASNPIGDAPGEMGANLASVKLVADGESADVKQLQCGRYHSCALGIYNGQKEVRCWGDNQHGEIGLAAGIAETTANFIGDNPEEVAQGLAKVALPSGNILQFKSGWYSSCALIEVAQADTTSNKVFCWGDFRSGTLGRGDTTDLGIGTVANGGDINAPIPGSMEDIKAVRFPDGKVITKLFGQGTTYCALSSEGELYCWGHNGSQKFGLDPSPTVLDRFIGDGYVGDPLVDGVEADEMGNALQPTSFGKDFEIERVEIGAYNMCALSNTGDIACFGLCVTRAIGLPCGNGVTLDQNLEDDPDFNNRPIEYSAQLGPNPLILGL